MSAKFEEITFKVEKETLSGTVTKTSGADMPSFLFLHGAGTADQTRAFYLMKGTLKYDISSFSFDFSGHGKSTGLLKESSLKKRVDEAATAMNFLSSDKPVAVYGSSMGGHIAIRLLEQFKNISSLVLFAPAVYDRRAYELPFDNSFSQIIREKESWANSEIFSLLEQFKGKLLIFVGEQDKIIPRKLIDSLGKHAPQANKKEIVWIPECDHAIHTWITARPKLTEQVLTKISEFV